MAKKVRFTKQEKSWIAYHVAKSAFILTVSATIMPIFFKDFASKGVDTTVSTANWAFGLSLASFCLAILTPALGSIADQKHAKKPFLAFFICEGIVFTGALVFVGEGSWLLCLLLYILARIGFAGANMFYDSLLVDVTTKDRMDWVSVNGFGWGYIGGVIPFVICMAVIFTGRGDSASGDSIPAFSAKITFVITACWWLLFSLPLLLHVTQKKAVAPSPKLISFTNFFATFTECFHQKNVGIFLIAYFFYINGVHTNIGMATAYGREIGLGMPLLVAAILMIQLVAFPCTLLAGKLAKAFSTKTVLFIGIIIYSIITLLSFFLPAIADDAAKGIVFGCIAFLVATSQGGMQALSRSYFGKLLPEQNTAKFYGFYSLFRKFATIVGPFTMGIVARLTGHSRWGVLSMLVFFFIGAILLTRVSSTASVELKQ